MQAEKIGMGLSAVCAVHCAALPFVAGLSAVSHNVWFEAGMIGTAALIGFGTLGKAFRSHRQAAPLALLVGGLLLLMGAHTVMPEAWEMAASVAGAGLMLAAQLVNRKITSSCCTSCHCSPAPLQLRA